MSLEDKLAALRERYRNSFPSKVKSLREAHARLRVHGDGAEDQVRQLAHKLAGTGTSYGYPEISTLARATELASDAELGDELEALIALIEGIHSCDRPV